MELKELFTIKSRKQREQERAAYEERIFNLGTGHRNLVLVRMRQAVKEKKTEEELFYIYACAKDFYLQGKETGKFDKLCRWYDTTYLYPEDKNRVIAFIRAEESAAGLEDYPEVDELSAGERETVLFLENVKKEGFNS